MKYTWYTSFPGTKFQRLSSTSSRSGSGKVIVSLIATTGFGLTGAIVYGKYDPKFKELLQENIPYVSYIYKWFPEEDQKSTSPRKESAVGLKDVAVSDSLLKKKLDREKAAATEVKRPAVEPQTRKPGAVAQTSDDTKKDSIVKKSEIKLEEKVELSEKAERSDTLKEAAVTDMLKKLEKSSEETVAIHMSAVKAIKNYTKKLYEALDMPEGKDGDIVWKEASSAGSEKAEALKLAERKASDIKAIIEKLQVNLKYIAEKDAKNPLLKTSEELISEVKKRIQNAEAKLSSAETEARTATEYQNLVNTSKEQFRKELQIVLPNYIHGDKSKTMTESDLNLLIAHAHRRIEQLQKQLAKQQVTEKFRVDEAVRQQKKQDEKVTESKIEAELERRHLDLETAVANRVAALKDNFEVELRQQLRRQAAAHADHIQEVLKVQEQELERKHCLELEEKLLHQKGVFISEVSGNMARLKGILTYLKAKGEFDKLSKSAQSLWLACQAMSDKIEADKSGELYPLSKEIAAVKVSASEDNEFINCVLASIPSKAVTRGVYTSEDLKQRFFENVKPVCRKVALIDENNDSLYRYLLSYLQSFLTIDVISIPKEELSGKVAVDPSEWDTFDILSRISYCLKINDMEQALRYANQLRGEPRVVATDFINEVRLLLETRLAVKALLAHAAAVSVQAYH
ncbi:MICOS complex subunit Mic60-like isoform X2 [Stegodyphus dumicola]|uniref:MICOS complex subunit Mic60-like isoform X2 n=1 Tax=Stegodyphus dumicola TaxID=202533 RepID=UPI0015A893C8|nr:MICOS complex subunit Mic60-like isoform X2 [Stegodyphus dumicola]